MGISKGYSSFSEEELDGCPSCIEEIPCSRGDGVHKWSGWPGAFCLSCKADDPEEACLSYGCKCGCHGPAFVLK